MALLRYPGGKSRLAAALLEILHPEEGIEFREPFFGGGSVSLQLLNRSPCSLRPFWINDVDPGVFSLWNAVLQDPEGLRGRILALEPTERAFTDARDLLLSGVAAPGTDLGFAKLVANRLSYSGVAEMGGPLKDIGCRWNAKRLAEEVLFLHMRFAQRTRCTSLDFEEVLRAPGSCFIYLDPPYWEAGPQLYAKSFQREDHERLARVLRDVSQPWLLSYDDHPEIRRLYDWAFIGEIATTHDMSNKGKKREIYVTPRPPDAEDLFALVSSGA